MEKSQGNKGGEGYAENNIEGSTGEHWKNTEGSRSRIWNPL
jgi:hypothetical protein